MRVRLVDLFGRAAPVMSLDHSWISYQLSAISAGRIAARGAVLDAAGLRAGGCGLNRWGGSQRIAPRSGRALAQRAEGMRGTASGGRWRPGRPFPISFWSLRERRSPATADPFHPHNPYTPSGRQPFTDGYARLRGRPRAGG